MTSEGTVTASATGPKSGINFAAVAVLRNSSCTAPSIFFQVSWVQSSRPLPKSMCVASLERLLIGPPAPNVRKAYPDYKLLTIHRGSCRGVLVGQREQRGTMRGSIIRPAAPWKLKRQVHRQLYATATEEYRLVNFILGSPLD